MSARIPRRRFSSPFVVTIAGAAAGACFVQSSTPPSQPISQSNPGQPTQTDPRPTPPPPETQSPTYIANPPRPTSPPPDPSPPVEQGPVAEADPPAPPPGPAWMITKADGKCTAQAITHCPPRALCNPPRPSAYKCVEGITYPAKVTKTGNECRVERDPPCPRNAKCKAPPVVPCP